LALAESKAKVVYDLGIYECSLGRRTYFLLKPKSKANLPDMTREEVIEKKKFPVLVVDRPCGLELFHVSTEEPTSEGPR
jgi:hypothetical protein